MRNPRIPPPTLVLIVLCIMSFVMYVARTNIATAALVIRSDLGISNASMGLVFSAFAVTYAVGSIPGGYLADKFGPFRTLAICGVLWAGGTALTGFAGGFASLLVARLIVGLGEAPIVPASARAMAIWTPAGRRGFAQGITHSVARLGNAAAPLIVAGLVAVASWRIAFIVMGVISLSWVVLWVSTYHEEPLRHPGMTPALLSNLPGGGRTERPPLRFLSLLRVVWPATIGSFCHGWTLWFFLNWTPSFFAQSYGMKLTSSAIFSTGIFLGGVLGTTLGGTFSDFLLRRTGSVLTARRSVLLVGYLSPVVFLLPMLFTPSLPVAAACLSVALFLSELVTAPLWAVSMDLAPNHAGLSSAVMNTGLGIAASISPPIVGWLVDWSGTWQAAFGLSIAVMALGPVATFFIRPDRPYLGEGVRAAAPGVAAAR